MPVWTNQVMRSLDSLLGINSWDTPLNLEVEVYNMASYFIFPRQEYLYWFTKLMGISENTSEVKPYNLD